MWDIDQIIRNNNAAVLEYFQDGRRVNAAYNPILEEWPLSILAAKMKAGPVNIKTLTDLLQDDSDDIGLQTLSRKFLPEFEIEIMGMQRGKRVGQFCKRFSERHYELQSDTYRLNSFGLCKNLPVTLMGLSKADYHDLNFRRGYLLLMSLVVYPWGEEEEDMGDGYTDEDGETVDAYEVVSNGGRLPLLDIVQKNIGKSTVNRILPGGWIPEELHILTDGTKYDGVGYLADWICGTTGCYVLDNNYSNCSYINGTSEPYFKWSSYNVEILGEQWKRVVEYRTKIDNIVNWIEATPDSNFTELVDYLAREYKPPQDDAKRVIPVYRSTYDVIRLETMQDKQEYEEQQEELYGGTTQEDTESDGIDTGEEEDEGGGEGPDE
jgi:hypothetical protein